MNIENIDQILAEKELAEKEISNIKENFGVKKKEAEENASKELDGINTKYSSVLSIAEKNLEIKKGNHEEAIKKLSMAKKELMDAMNSHKEIGSSFKKAKHDYDKKYHTIVKTIESDLAFALKAKEKEIKHIDKKIQAYNKIK
ncbi:hypothetical protein DSAG12_00948 [Promethearchaeum syntrophicum]|uniref:Uncharacterized protein n=1 Tax=Promethearchaeum syntrophicum TaxID=2594042 RepID=A0A5B9D7Y0_9ARCH|nr:hypothetical protein [Candidatus Prometheoarchaeum syntrophicum]QEE15125.1 hypothetical protein DSAG12_00948 [Candidatus Prometheoarchaeum syntrophicum]